MLINFTVGNYKSIRDKKTLSLEATSIREHKERVVVKDNLKLLPVIAIYGANSSGKSNFLDSMLYFRHYVATSLKTSSTDKFDVEPFLLTNRTKQEPTFFEVELLIESSIYRYGYCLNKEKITEEWLYAKVKGKGREKELFYRTLEKIECSINFPEGKDLEGKTRHNALFLSVVDSFNGEISKKVVKEITNIYVMSGIQHNAYSELTVELCKIDKLKEGIISLFNSLDLGIKRIEIPEDKELAEKIKAFTIHNVYDEDGNVIGEEKLTMAGNESAGTNKLFDILSIILFSISNGYTLIIDELDSKLHPLISRYLIDMFSDASNTQNGTLIFATHDTNLLDSNLLRRDQIWFVEKDKTEATDLYSLVEFTFPDGTKIRNDRSFEKDYIKGRYGAIPYIK